MSAVSAVGEGGNALRAATANRTSKAVDVMVPISAESIVVDERAVVYKGIPFKAASISGHRHKIERKLPPLKRTVLKAPIASSLRLVNMTAGLESSSSGTRSMIALKEAKVHVLCVSCFKSFKRTKRTTAEASSHTYIAIYS